MTNIPQAVQDAVYAALNITALTDVAPVVQHILEDTQPPLFVIGDISSSPEGGKGGGLDKVTVDIWTYSRQPSRTQLYSMQALVRQYLENQTLTAAGYTLSQPVEMLSESSLLEDGETYVGTQRFELFAQ